MDPRSTTDSDAPSAPRRFRLGATVAAALLLAAMVAVSPHVLSGFPGGHSVQFNLFWYECFRDQLFGGELLPRWLFEYWDGLGAPVFYFYAPFPYYLLTLGEFLLVGQWGDFGVLTMGHLLLFFLSGVAFYVLVRRYLGPFWATATAIGYMLAPYHYIDVEKRAAMGEASAYIWIPLILIGASRTDRTWRSTVLTSFAYAGLVLSHLPSALLAAPAIALFFVLASERSERLWALAHALTVGALGVSLSAFYVLPSLLLRDTVSFDGWVTAQGAFFVASKWLIGSPDLPKFGRYVYEVLGGTTAIGLGSWAVHETLRRSRFGDGLERPDRRLTMAIAAVLCLCWFLMSGLSRPLWEHVPFLSQVQFPWRLGVLVDVCSLLLIALFAPPLIERAATALGFVGRRRKALVFGFCAVALAVLATVDIQMHSLGTVQTRADIRGTEAPVEYRTTWLVTSPVYLGARDPAELHDIATAPKAHRAGVRRWKRHVNRLGPISPLRQLQPGESVRIDSNELGRATMSIILSSAATIRVNKVYYPHWRLMNDDGDEIETRPDEKTGLLAFELPEGRHELSLDRRILPVELVGLVVSLLAALAALGFVRRSRAT